MALKNLSIMIGTNVEICDQVEEKEPIQRTFQLDKNLHATEGVLVAHGHPLARAGDSELWAE